MRLVRTGKAIAGIGIGVALAVIGGVVGWAWVDGGREPLHPIAEPVPVPEAAR